jgi:biopolymer transport protein ExbD
MAGFSSRKPNAPITGINVTPLVDITLVLLIIFMVTAKLVVSRALLIELPSAATGGEVAATFTVALQRDGALSVDGGAVVTEAGLLTLARTSMRAHPELRAIVQADAEAPHRHVMRLLDVLRQAGVTKIGFGVQPMAAVETEPPR